MLTLMLWMLLLVLLPIVLGLSAATTSIAIAEASIPSAALATIEIVSDILTDAIPGLGAVAHAVTGAVVRTVVRWERHVGGGHRCGRSRGTLARFTPLFAARLAARLVARFCARFVRRAVAWLAWLARLRTLPRRATWTALAGGAIRGGRGRRGGWSLEVRIGVGGPVGARRVGDGALGRASGGRGVVGACGAATTRSASAFGHVAEC